MFPKRLVPIATAWGIIAVVTLGVSLGWALKHADVGIWNGWFANLFQAVYVSLTFGLVWLTYGLFKIATDATTLSREEHRQKITPIVAAAIVQPGTAKRNVIYGVAMEEFVMRVKLSNLSKLPALNVYAFFDLRPYTFGMFSAVDSLDAHWRYKNRPNVSEWPNSVAGARHFIPLLQPEEDEYIEIALPITVGTPLQRYLTYTKGLEYPFPWMNLNAKDTYIPESPKFQPLSLVVTLVYSDLYGNQAFMIQEDIGGAARSVNLKIVRPPLAERMFARDISWDFDRWEDSGSRAAAKVTKYDGNADSSGIE